jgi:hypothetical protein
MRLLSGVTCDCGSTNLGKLRVSSHRGWRPQIALVCRTVNRLRNLLVLEGWTSERGMGPRVLPCGSLHFDAGAPARTHPPDWP